MADLQSKDNKDNDNTVDVLQHVPTEGGDLDAAYFAEVDDLHFYRKQNLPQNYSNQQ